MVYEHSNAVINDSESHTGDESDTTHSNLTDSRRGDHIGCPTPRTVNGSGRYLQVARPQHCRNMDSLEDTSSKTSRLGSITPSNCFLAPHQSPDHLISSKEESSKCQGSCSTTLSTTPLVEDTDSVRNTLLISQDSSSTTRGPAMSHSSSSEHIRKFLAEKQKISLTNERRVARTMAVIMGAFVACWLPFFLMYVIFPFCSYCAVNTDPRVINFLVWLGYANSTLNPIIYTVFNVDFRRAFKILLRIDRGQRRRLY